MPVLWGGVHLAKGPVSTSPARHSLRPGSDRGAVGQDALALPGGLLLAVLVHRGHRGGAATDAYPDGCGDRGPRPRSVAEVAVLGNAKAAPARR